MGLVKVIAIGLFSLNLAACTWVNLSPEGEKVRILKADEVSSCKRLGKTTVKTAAKVVGLERHDHKVAAELETLARNSAIDIGGDTVVAIDLPVDGRQQYEIYRCIPE